MIIQFVKRHKVDAILAIGLFIIALAPRVIGLGSFLTADEKTWMGRSYEFIRAFEDLRFNDMLQTTHPGVTTLWISGIAITMKSFISHIPFTNNNLIYFVKTSQFSIAFLNALAIPIMYVLLLIAMRNRFLSILAVLILALDPFIIGYSRVVHVDALMGSLLTLAVLTSILYAKYLTRPWLIASAILSIFAILTKVPAIFIAPFIVIALAIYHPRSLRSFVFLKDRLRDGAIWVLMSIVITLLVWPALLWVPNPAGNVLVLNRDISAAAVTPHDSNEEYNLDVRHYPFALLDRSTPLTLAAAIVGCAAIIWLIYKKRMPKEMLLMAVYLFGFILMMTLGAKKGDRYIISAFFALDILAAYGLLLIAQRFRSNKSNIIVALLSVFYLVYVLVSYHPYEIAYSNPLFPDNLSQELGWGEGLDQVAAWLDKNDPHAVVASWYPEELGTFTSATVLHINAHTQNPVRYIVLYKNMFGRAPEHYANDFIDEYYKKRQPVYVVKIAGKEYAWVYQKPSYTSTLGGLDSKTIGVQEVVADHEGLAGFQFLPATHFGQSDQGAFDITVSKTLTGPAIYHTTIPLNDTKDTQWQRIVFPDNLSIRKGDRLFIRVRGVDTAKPYPSIRYSAKNYRSTPMYISRTGSVADAKQKTGSLGIQLLYHGTDGKIATELEVKLLK